MLFVWIIEFVFNFTSLLHMREKLKNVIAVSGSKRYKTHKNQNKFEREMKNVVHPKYKILILNKIFVGFKTLILCESDKEETKLNMTA